MFDSIECGIRRRLGLALILAVTLVGAGCGSGQQLVGITIEPSTETFGSASTPVQLDAGLNVQLRALGTYIHPPATKDITDQVTWVSNAPQMVTVSSTGVITATGQSCGNTLISATVTKNSTDAGLSSPGAVVTGNMTANVTCFTGTGPTLTVDFAGTGTGTIASSPAGLGCAATCSTSFATGTTVTLTATPTGSSTFVGWAGCDIASGQACTVTLTDNRTVTVTFN